MKKTSGSIYIIKHPGRKTFFKLGRVDKTSRDLLELKKSLNRYKVFPGMTAEVLLVAEMEDHKEVEKAMHNAWLPFKGSGTGKNSEWYAGNIHDAVKTFKKMYPDFIDITKKVNQDNRKRSGE